MKVLNLLRILSLIFTIPLLSDEIEDQLYDLTQDGYEQYEDIYVQGRVIKKASHGERYSEERFAIIDSVLQRYQRPFTVLDIGSAQGYFCFRGAERYPDSTFIMFEGTNHIHPLISKQIASICKLNKYLKNVVWLDRQIVVPEILDLASCEHVDVILALNVLHWFPKQWSELLLAMTSMSQITIVEVPPAEERVPADHKQTRVKLHRHLAKIAKQIIVGVPRHTNPLLKTTFYILENGSEFPLKKISMLHSTRESRSYQVHADYDCKYLVKKESKEPFNEYTSAWIPGINLITYLVFNGGWPEREEMIKLIPESSSHNDWMPNNMVVQGHALALIDTDDPWNEKDTPGLYFPCNPVKRNKIEELILNKDPNKIKELFKKIFKDEN